MSLSLIHTSWQWTKYPPSVRCSPQCPCCRLTAVGSCSGYYPPPISAQHSTAGDDSILLLQGLAWKCFASSWRSRTLPQMFSFYYCINVPWHMTITDDAIKREHLICFGWFLSGTFSTSLFGQSKCEMECNITWFPLSGCCKEWCLSQSWSTQSDCLERSPARNSAKCPTNTNKMQLNIRHTTQTGLYLAADFQTWSNFVKLIV